VKEGITKMLMVVLALFIILVHGMNLDLEEQEGKLVVRG
jgi:hypothetical protein